MTSKTVLLNDKFSRTVFCIKKTTGNAGGSKKL